MINNLLIRNAPKPFKFFLFSFLVVLSIGFFTGLTFVNNTQSSTPKGITENYNGNEMLEDLEVIKFKKGAREMLTIIHTHILSISLIFFLLGLLIWGTEINLFWKSFLTIEPFISVLVTFGGIYFIWLEYTFISHIVMISGILMTLSFTLGVILIGLALLKPPIQNSKVTGSGKIKIL
jgi:sterol desaturase/sphingolipid hydroxylase (fatty acid hydroxylase superfamily)